MDMDMDMFKRLCSIHTVTTNILLSRLCQGRRGTLTHPSITWCLGCQATASRDLVSMRGSNTTARTMSSKSESLCRDLGTPCRQPCGRVHVGPVLCVVWSNRIVRS
ncbi:hypothetical protein HBH64_163030 [Parastagonospora nodorum]|nr:hypothetical protein HBH52_137620 [Parastagonospora nodorum]KAH4222779.1 hypothetical protein HBI06_138330 [Parastagonospora nodorum]KAH4297156.1 hypothetical protein HBI02_163650 [Parastagonospora nodorum]KAH4459315.1 hypothetical protein HBH90_150500 [Parastagonospora nodorum]KAH4582539.1 hypothetical protein HBH83_162740 [Parastagonospora nodorum]